MEKLPKPRISIPSPRQSASTIESNIWQIRSSARPCGSLARSAMRSMRSALVIGPVPALYPESPEEVKGYSQLRRWMGQSSPAVDNWQPSSQNLRAPEIRSQRRRHVDASVGALVGFEDPDQRPRERQAGAVQGVEKAGLFFSVLRAPGGRPLEPDVGAAGLEVTEVGAGADLQPFVAAGRPQLEVELGHRRERQVTRAHLHDAVGELQRLQDVLGVGQEGRQLVHGGVRVDELDQLH